MNLIDEAVNAGARRSRSCHQAGITLRTLQRWQYDGKVRADGRPGAIRPQPANKLSDGERKHIIQLCTQAEFADLPPTQIVPALADRGIYVASESSFYRVLKAENLTGHRGRAKPHGTYARPQSYTARAPNQVWSWDITHLPCVVKGERYYLYMIMDVFSRKITGAEVWEAERGEHASALRQHTVWAEIGAAIANAISKPAPRPRRRLAFQDE